MYGIGWKLLRWNAHRQPESIMTLFFLQSSSTDLSADKHSTAGSTTKFEPVPLKHVVRDRKDGPAHPKTAWKDVDCEQLPVSTGAEVALSFLALPHQSDFKQTSFKAQMFTTSPVAHAIIESAAL